MAETLSKATTRRCSTVFKPSRQLPKMRVRAGNCHLTLKVPPFNLLVLDGALTDIASLRKKDSETSSATDCATIRQNRDHPS